MLLHDTRELIRHWLRDMAADTYAIHCITSCYIAATILVTIDTILPVPPPDCFATLAAAAQWLIDIAAAITLLAPGYAAITPRCRHYLRYGYKRAILAASYRLIYACHGIRHVTADVLIYITPP